MSRDLAETRGFFAARADGWDAKFPDDGPAYAHAVEELDPPVGAIVLDAGCGTGRAVPPLQAAVGPSGRVIALDATPEMLAAGRRAGQLDGAGVTVADALRVPLRDGSVRAVFAAGLLPHLEDPVAGLRELARVCTGRLAVFHPVGRVALAARHGSVPSEDDPLWPAKLERLLRAAGWRLLSCDDGDDRYLALAVRSRVAT